MSEDGVTLGLRLKAERERRGFSTQKVGDDLHLDAWVIEALESGDYARIGPRVYAKGHLKHYAVLLGMSPDEALAAFDRGAAAPVPAPLAPVQASTLRLRTEETAVRDVPWLGVAGGVAAVLAVGAVGLWHYWRGRDAPVATTSASAASVADSGAEAGTGNSSTAAGGVPGAVTAGPTGPESYPPDASARVVGAGAPPIASPSGVPASVAVPGTGRARLRLRFSADSWVDVHDATGRRLFAGQGRANSVKAIAGAAPMKVYLGFASGVQLEVNNHVVAIGPQFLAGDVARFAAGADGVLRREPPAATPAAPASATPAPAPATTAAIPHNRG